MKNSYDLNRNVYLKGRLSRTKKSISVIERYFRLST